METPVGRPGPRELRFPARALRRAGVGVAALLVVLSAVGLLASQAVPGDASYPVKRFLNGVAVSVSDSGHDRGLTWLAQAREHIDEARRLDADGDGRGADAARAFEAAEHAARSGRAELERHSSEAGDDNGREALADFGSEASHELDALRPDVPLTSVPAWQSLRDLLGAYAQGD